MNVIMMNKQTFSVSNVQNVTNIAYNPTTKVYTLTYGQGETAQYSVEFWTLSIAMM